MFLPAEKRGYRPTDRRTDGRTHPLIESWLMTKKREEASRKAVMKIIANIQSRLAKNLGERKK